MTFYLLDKCFITAVFDWTVFGIRTLDTIVTLYSFCFCITPVITLVSIIWWLLNWLAMQIDWLVSVWFGRFDRSVCLTYVQFILFIYLFVLCYLCLCLLILLFYYLLLFLFLLLFNSFRCSCSGSSIDLILWSVFSISLFRLPVFISIHLLSLL